MSACCGRVTQKILTTIGFIDKEEPAISQGELSRRLQVEKRLWIPEKRKEFGDFWAEQTCPGISQHVQQSLDNFQREQIKPGFAVEIGCGNSGQIPVLLRKGWRIEAVDSSQLALNNLQKRVSQTASDKIDNLTLTCVDMETYQFPEDVRLILARDALPFCNPEKIIEVWDKAYDSLEDGGRIVGNFFPHFCHPMAEAIGRGVLGSWYTDKAVVKALLDRKKYEIEACEYSMPRYKELFFNKARQINFVGKKI